MEKESAKARFKNLLLLFALFMKIGLFTFGGGYAMISLIRREFIEKRKWVTAPEFTDMIAISESTPGPLAINSATYVGYKIGGFWGALCATVGVVLPSFVIILIIAAVFRTFLKNRVVQGALVGIRGVIVGLICATGLWLAVQLLFLTGEGGGFGFDWRALVIAAGLTAEAIVLKKCFKRSASPIMLILTAAALGALLYMI